MSYDDVDACLDWRNKRFDRLMPNYVNPFKFRRFRDLFKAMDNLYEVADFTFVEDETGGCKIIISPIDIDACYEHKTFDGGDENCDEYKEWYKEYLQKRKDIGNNRIKEVAYLIKRNKLLY